MQAALGGRNRRSVGPSGLNATVSGGSDTSVRPVNVSARTSCGCSSFSSIDDTVDVVQFDATGVRCHVGGSTARNLHPPRTRPDATLPGHPTDIRLRRLRPNVDRRSLLHVDATGFADHRHTAHTAGHGDAPTRRPDHEVGTHRNRHLQPASRLIDSDAATGTLHAPWTWNSLPSTARTSMRWLSPAIRTVIGAPSTHGTDVDPAMPRTRCCDEWHSAFLLRRTCGFRTFGTVGHTRHRATIGPEPRSWTGSQLPTRRTSRASGCRWCARRHTRTRHTTR